MGNVQSGYNGLSINDIMALQAQYSVGTIVIYVFPIIPLSILWGISLRSTHRKGDAARGAFAWIKTLFPIYILSLLMFVITRAMYLYVIDLDNVSGRTAALVQALDFLNCSGRYFEDTADILLLVVLVELGIGFLISLDNRDGPSKRAKLARYATLALALAFFVMASVYFALSVEFWDRYHKWAYGSSADRLKSPRAPRPNPSVGLLGSALNILFWGAVLPIVGCAAYIVHKTKHAVHLRQSAILFLAAALLDFARLTVGMVTTAIYDFGPNSIVRPLSLSYVAQPLLNTLPWFLLLVLLFVIGMRKEGGLWSGPRLDEIQSEARRVEAAESKTDKSSWREKFKKPTKQEWKDAVVSTLLTSGYQ
ncbi:hypothetical protein B0H67DRAFT_594609 [Lasiosphaeris hirsuta]|uniref:Uncharacterized protein n=1 Tax=Lasiosphaeris hirsuta TaxID=260670 RepID=A0AA40DLW8_9PEZI|nr:hypothetical protein B0H67DRAFT_594609 [Lasiosphaeris hirsuta]